jgi:hypothetical protein
VVVAAHKQGTNCLMRFIRLLTSSQIILVYNSIALYSNPSLIKRREIMSEMPVTPSEEQPKKSNTGLIIGIVVVVLLCCCCVVGGLAWTYGDAILQSLGSCSIKKSSVSAEDFLIQNIVRVPANFHKLSASLNHPSQFFQLIFIQNLARHLLKPISPTAKSTYETYHLQSQQVW